MNNYERRDYRCTNCGRLQFRAYLPEDSYLEMRCPKCGNFLVVEVKEHRTTVTAEQIQVVKVDVSEALKQDKEAVDRVFNRIPVDNNVVKSAVE